MGDIYIEIIKALEEKEKLALATLITALVLLLELLVQNIWSKRMGHL